MKRRMVTLLLVLGLVVLGLVLSPSGAIAYETHSGTISADQIWEAGVHYVSGSVTVNNGVTLTVSAGAVVKFALDTQMTVYGRLGVNGTSGSPVVFTSIRDDTYGGDTNGDGTTTSAAPGDWKGIYLYGYSSSQGIGEFDYCRLRYGGNTNGDADANVYFGQSDSGYFRNSVSEYSGYDGLKIESCSVNLQGNTFCNNLRYGALLTGDLGLTAVWSGNIFSGNGYGDGFSLQGTISGKLSSATYILGNVQDPLDQIIKRSRVTFYITLEV